MIQIENTLNKKKTDPRQYITRTIWHYCLDCRFTIKQVITDIWEMHSRLYKTAIVSESIQKQREYLYKFEIKHAANKTDFNFVSDILSTE